VGEEAFERVDRRRKESDVWGLAAFLIYKPGRVSSCKTKSQGGPDRAVEYTPSQMRKERIRGGRDEATGKGGGNLPGSCDRPQFHDKSRFLTGGRGLEESKGASG